MDGSVGASSGDESDSEEDDDEEEEDLDDGCYVFEPGKDLVGKGKDDGRGHNEQGHWKLLVCVLLMVFRGFLQAAPSGRASVDQYPSRMLKKAASAATIAVHPDVCIRKMRFL